MIKILQFKKPGNATTLLWVTRLLGSIAVQNLCRETLGTLQKRDSSDVTNISHPTVQG